VAPGADLDRASAGGGDAANAAFGWAYTRTCSWSCASRPLLIAWPSTTSRFPPSKQTTAAARIADGYEKQQQTESQARDRAQAMDDTTVQTVEADLATMLEQAQSGQGRPRRSTR
jgi:hypothetical protein